MSTPVTVRPLRLDDAPRAAQVLFDACAADFPDAWPTIESARREVEEALDRERVTFGAWTGDDALIGWIGAIPQYCKRDLATGWELHPLCVDPTYHGGGVGRTLVRALEEALRHRGATVIYLGTDDESGVTIAADREITDVPHTIAELRRHADSGARVGHPYAFYRRCGYRIVGLIPDASGIGRPDILMARRVAARSDPSSVDARESTAIPESPIEEIDPAAAPLDLLLEADPSEERIRTYLAGAHCYAVRLGEEVVAVCVVNDIAADRSELFNIAVSPALQGRGIGSRLLDGAIERTRERGITRMEVGTGSFGYQLAFYQRRGFRVESIVRNFFVDHYHEPIIEAGVHLMDMIRLSLTL